MALAILPLKARAAAETTGSAAAASTCGSIKKMYQSSECCGQADKLSNFQVVPMPQTYKLGSTANNVCAGMKPTSGFENFDCYKDEVVAALEQSGTNVTVGYKGTNTKTAGTANLYTGSYYEKGLCPVNVHWHLGAEHLSVGEYDENGKGPAHRRLATDIRLGFRCHHYDANDPKFTTEYNWQHCVNTHVGETYEVHWPHSQAGACGTPNQFQSPFYDGVLCHISKLGDLSKLPSQVGVQGQVYTIVNDEAYFYPDLLRGMIVDGDFGKDITAYTGSTTGTTRSNEKCSAYAPITWQVDRTCHLISASTFDKMCADMKQMGDDMSMDLHPHGARELVTNGLAANNLADAEAQQFLR